MKRKGFVLQLRKGFEDEYQRRHTEIWPQLHELLKKADISEYSIFLHPVTNQLFGYLKSRDESALNELPNQEIMKNWWSFMKDIMETNEDESPVSIELKGGFYLP